MPFPLRFASAATQLGALVLAIGADQGAALAAFGLVARAGPAWQSMRGGEIDARIAQGRFPKPAWPVGRLKVTRIGHQLWS